MPCDAVQQPRGARCQEIKVVLPKLTVYLCGIVGDVYLRERIDFEKDGVESERELCTYRYLDIGC